MKKVKLHNDPPPTDRPHMGGEERWPLSIFLALSLSLSQRVNNKQAYECFSSEHWCPSPFEVCQNPRGLELLRNSNRR